MNALFDLWLSLTIRSSALFAAVVLILHIFRPRRAAVVHGLWTFALIASLALPVAMNALPRLWVPRLIDREEPQRLRAAITTASGVKSSPAVPWKAGALLWPAGAFLVCARFVADVMHVRRLGRTSHDAGPEWTTRVRTLAIDSGVGRPIVVYRNPDAMMAVTWGIARPAILLPHDVDQWPEELQRAVLLHEIAHIRRNDCLTQTIARAACALYWINPLVWIGARAMEHSRESACDEEVVSAGIPPAEYGGFLIEMSKATRLRAVPLAPIASPRGLEARLQALRTDIEREPRRRVAQSVIIALTFLAAGTIDVDARDGRWRSRVSEVKRVPAAAGDRVLIETSGRVLSPIRVETWKGDEIEVRTEKATDTTGPAAERVFADAPLRVVRDKNLVSVSVSNSGEGNVRVRFRVLVPEGSPVQIRSAGGGVTVDGHPGAVDATTSGGPISIGEASGEVRAATQGGSIRIGRAAGQAHATTGSGNIDVAFASISGNSELQSEHGDIVATIPRGASPSIRATVHHSKPDRSRIRSVIPLTFVDARRIAIDSPDADAQWWATDATAAGTDGTLKISTSNGVIRIE